MPGPGAAGRRGFVFRLDTPGGSIVPLPLSYEYQVYQRLQGSNVSIAAAPGGGAAQAAAGAERQKMMQEHMRMMQDMMAQMQKAKPAGGMAPQQMREWIDEHLKVMDQMMSQMMDAEHMMMGPMRGSQNMDMMKGSK